MDTYDPDTPPAPADWLGADEGDRIELVSTFHRLGKIKLPDPQLHSVVHVVVENQVALGEEIVVDTLARLQTEGLSRHDALHAIGSVLAENLYELMQEDGEAAAEPYRRYLERLRQLTAESWRTGSGT